MRYKIPRKNKITEKETAYMQDLIKGDLIIYEDENDKIEIEAFLYNETIWLPLNKIAELFEKDKSVISRHISNIFEEQELTQIQLLQILQQFNSKVIVKLIEILTITI